MEMIPTITVRGLTKTFGEAVAVENLSFEAREGEIFGLLGENGAGKTTTLRMLATLLTPTRGEASVGGADVVREPERVRRSLGIVFDAGVYERLSARENIRYFGRLHGLSGADLERRVDELLTTLAMNEYADKRAGTFSKGMRQKVVIARALVHDPPILLMDEPTSGLDVTAARGVQQFVLQAKERGKCIVFSSHNMTEVEKLCDRVAVMHRSRIAAEGSIAELREASANKSFEEVFVGLVGEER